MLSCQICLIASLCQHEDAKGTILTQLELRTMRLWLILEQLLAKLPSVRKIANNYRKGPKEDTKQNIAQAKVAWFLSKAIHQKTISTLLIKYSCGSCLKFADVSQDQIIQSEFLTFVKKVWSSPINLTLQKNILLVRNINFFKCVYLFRTSPLIFGFNT